MQIGRRNLRKGLLGVGALIGAPTLLGTTLGIVPITLGAALHLWSKGCLEQNRRLTTAGPYRFTRNPFYLANALIDAGLCLVIGRPVVAVAFGMLWFWAYRDTIAAEEDRLRALFPDAYAHYSARVPRFLPDGRRFPREQVTGRFSLDNPGLARGQEYARLLGIALGPAVVWAAAALRADGAAIFAGTAPVGLAWVFAVPALWVVKLGLAEIFRRPESVLVPGLGSQTMRAATIATLGVSAALAGSRLPWVSVLIVMWGTLVGLDALRVARADAPPADERIWRYLAPVSLASTAAAGLLLWTGSP